MKQPSKKKNASMLPKIAFNHKSPNVLRSAFLTTQLLTYEEDLWLGMNDINWDMHFVWTDGRGVSYTNWAKGHPTSTPEGRYSFMNEVLCLHMNWIQVYSHHSICIKISNTATSNANH